ncbi:MAG: NAD-dependent epimerase/dehydratase family protein, partial [Bdellovibrionales bacterium]|nr:NAD-dependent epimerase/dehydratase family protein [Bdellovibrionales bacterium]
MSRKILVTGGAGFIGSHIVDAFLACGDEVYVIDDLSSGNLENLNPAAHFTKADIRSEEAARFVADLRPDILVHAAAQISVSMSMKDPKHDAEVNVVGLANLLHAFGGSDFPHVVFISTGGAIYGEQEVYPADESHVCQPTSMYGLNKYVSEQYLQFWHREMGLTYTVLRLSNVYGPRQSPHGEAGVIAIFHKYLLGGKTPTIFGTGAQTRDFVFVGDVVSAVLSAAETKTSGTFNIGTGAETSVNELYQLICNSLRTDISPHYEPSRPGEQMRSCITAALANKKLGWEPSVTLAEGIQKTS